MKPKYLISACLLFLILGCATDIAGLLSLGLLMISCWLLMAGGLVYFAWGILTHFRVLRWKPVRALVFVPLLLGAFAASGILGILLSTRPGWERENGVSVERELKCMYDVDQSDRYSGRFLLLPGRDKARLSRAREIIRLNADSLSGEAMYHAAMILQHGNSSGDFESAHHLARSAFEAGVVKAEGLSRAAYDRWQLSIGKPQKYGTQSTIRIGITGIETDTPDADD